MKKEIIRKSQDSGKQKIIDEMLGIGVGIIKYGDFYFIQSNNYMTTKKLNRYDIGCKYETLIFPRVGDCFKNVHDAFSMLNFAYVCIQNGDPDQGF